MIDDRVPVDLPKITFQGGSDFGYSCSLTLVPDRLAYSVISDDQDNIIQFRGSVEVLDSHDESSRVYSWVAESILVSELKRFEAVISELHEKYN